MINIKKLRPLFTKIVTTMNRYEEDQTTDGGLVVAQKQAGAVKEYQTIVAVGSNSAGLKVGDVVMVNPSRYAVMKHKEGSLKDGVISDNPVLGYNLPIIELDKVPHLLLETSDIDFVVEEYEEDKPEETLEAKAAKAGIYTPGTSKII